MEERSVVPHQVAPRWSPRTYVPYQPLHTFGSITSRCWAVRIPMRETSSTVRSECPRASKAAVSGELPPPTSITLSDGPIPTRSSICKTRQREAETSYELYYRPKHDSNALRIQLWSPLAHHARASW